MSEPHAAPAVASTDVITLDTEVLRAQMVNALASACGLLEANNQGLATKMTLIRVMDMAVMFHVDTNAFGGRYYLFRLINPDGTQATLVRINEQAQALDFEPFDSAFLQAISTALPDTVCKSYHLMVNPPATPTHEGSTTLQ